MALVDKDGVDEETLEGLWKEIWLLLEQGDSQSAAAATLKALNDHGDAAELRYLLAVALMDGDEVDAALVELERAAELAPDWPEASSALGWAYFRACRFAEAAEMVSATLELDVEVPEVHQLRGLLAERSGQEAVALEAFAEARRMDEDRFPEPYEMDAEEFLEIAQVAVAEIDEVVRNVLEETAFFVQPFPAEDLLREADPPLDPQLLGLFVGRSLLEQSVQDSGTLPNTMYLFQHNLERAVTSRVELEEEIRITVLHEIGHHLGWGEDELEARGLA